MQMVEKISKRERLARLPTYLSNKLAARAIKNGCPKRIAFGKYWTRSKQVNARGVVVGWMWHRPAAIKEG